MTVQSNLTVRGRVTWDCGNYGNCGNWNRGLCSEELWDLILDYGNMVNKVNKMNTGLN
jgi:hypothetical protein